jgi:hypothetical protein
MKEEFFKAWESTDIAEEIREAFESDQAAEDEHKTARHPYRLVNGEMVKDDQRGGEK